MSDQDLTTVNLLLWITIKPAETETQTVLEVSLQERPSALHSKTLLPTIWS